MEQELRFELTKYQERVAGWAKHKRRNCPSEKEIQDREQGGGLHSNGVQNAGQRTKLIFKTFSPKIPLQIHRPQTKAMSEPRA